MKITRQHFIKLAINSAIIAGSSGLINDCGNKPQEDRNDTISGYNKKAKGAIMIKTAQISSDFKKKLAMNYSPIGFYFTDKKPEGSVTFKNSGNGCIIPRVLASAKGKTYCFDKNNLPSCASFFLGYRDSLFFGAEYFLSHAPLAGGMCERFVKTPGLARKYIKSKKYEEKSKGFATFKPLEQFTDSEEPELVIFFANPDQLSGLVYLLYFGAPLDDDRVVAGFASGCGSVVTLPLQHARKGMKKAVWGLHDVSARAYLPADLMTLTMPYELLVEIWKDIKKSFVITGTWDKIARRIAKNNKIQSEKKDKSKFKNHHSNDDKYKKCDACH